MTALTDPTDRARLRALALVGAGILVATTFIWVRLAVGAPSTGEPAAPAAVVENAAAGVASREVRR